MIVVYRFCRVVFGVSSSPFLLSATLRHHLQTYIQEVPEFVKVLEEYYVDDFNSGEDSVQGGFKRLCHGSPGPICLVFQLLALTCYGT